MSEVPGDDSPREHAAGTEELYTCMDSLIVENKFGNDIWLHNSCHELSPMASVYYLMKQEQISWSDSNHLIYVQVHP